MLTSKTEKSAYASSNLESRVHLAYGEQLKEQCQNMQTADDMLMTQMGDIDVFVLIAVRCRSSDLHCSQLL